MALNLHNRNNVTVPVAKTTKVLKIRDVETITNIPACLQCRVKEEMLTDLHYDYINTIECMNACHYFLERIFEEHTQAPKVESKDTDLQQMDILTEPVKVSEIEDTTEKTEILQSDPKTEGIVSSDVEDITIKTKKLLSTRNQGKDYIKTVIEELKKVCEEELDTWSKHSQIKDKPKEIKKQKEPDSKKPKKSPIGETPRRLTKEDRRNTKDDRDSLASEIQKARRAQRNHEVLEQDKQPAWCSAGQKKSKKLYPKLRISHKNPNKRPLSPAVNERPTKENLPCPDQK